jgi:nucleoside-diphosphate-sugar epimerase
MAELLDHEERLDAAAIFHMHGHWDPDGQQMAAAIARVVGRPIKQRRFPWRLVSLLSSVVPLFRELAEMRYLWDRPLRMPNRQLVAVLGREPHTPIDVAVRATLAGLGCLSEGDRAQDPGGAPQSVTMAGG